jgi:hypothetical protein
VFVHVYNIIDVTLGMTIDKSWVELDNRRSPAFLTGLQNLKRLLRSMSTVEAKRFARVNVVAMGLGKIQTRFQNTYMTMGFYNHIRHGFITVRNIRVLRI